MCDRTKKSAVNTHYTGRGRTIFSSPKRPDQLCHPPSPRYVAGYYVIAVKQRWAYLVLGWVTKGCRFASRCGHWDFPWRSPSGRTVVLGLTQPVTEMSTRGISWGCGGKGGRCVGLTTFPPLCADFVEILKAWTYWSPQGLSRSV